MVSSQKVLDWGPFILSLGVTHIPGLKVPPLSSFQLLVSMILCLPVSGNILASASSVSGDRKVNPKSSIFGQNSSALSSFPCKHISLIEVCVLSLPLFRLIGTFQFNSSNIYWATPWFVVTHQAQQKPTSILPGKVFFFSFSVVNPRSPTHVSSLVSSLEDSKYHDCRHLPASEAA